MLMVAGLGLLLFMIAIPSVIFSNMVIYPKTHPTQYTYDMEVEWGRILPPVFDKLPKQEIKIRSPYGYELFGLYFPVGNSCKTVILCHGIKWTLYGSVKYMDLFLKRGFNVLITDHRNHGRSGGNNTTYGYYEKYDLKAWTDWVFEKNGPEAVVGTMGESLGAATVLQNTAIDPRIAFCIADCPYSDLFELLTYRMKVQYGMPPFPFVYTSNLASWLRTGMSYGQVSPILDISHVNTPVFFIHGKNDTYIPPEMSISMYHAKSGMKKLYLAPDADHSEAFLHNREEYDRQIGEFLALVSTNPY